MLQQRPILDIGKFSKTRMFIAGWNNQVCVIRKSTQRVSRSCGIEISSSYNMGSRSNGRSLYDASGDIKQRRLLIAENSAVRMIAKEICQPVVDMIRQIKLRKSLKQG